jgi:parvulin-like peptidyl-prolyl isomerase
MTQVLQSEIQKAVAAEEILSLLGRYQLIPHLLREVVIDRAIDNISYIQEEQFAACEQFYQNHHLITKAQRQAWLELHNLEPEQLTDIATRELKIEKFKQAMWEQKLNFYFLSRKQQLDKVIYSMIRVKDPGMAQEIYFRIQEGEQSFAELARKYSQGGETQTGGLFGPFELGRLDPKLARLLYSSQPGQLWGPIPLGEWQILLRLEKRFPAQLDKPMQQRLYQELFDDWLRRETRQLNGKEMLLQKLLNKHEYFSESLTN